MTMMKKTTSRTIVAGMKILIQGRFLDEGETHEVKLALEVMSVSSKNSRGAKIRVEFAKGNEEEWGPRRNGYIFLKSTMIQLIRRDGCWKLRITAPEGVEVTSE